MSTPARPTIIQEPALRKLPLHFSKIKQMPAFRETLRATESDTYRCHEFACHWFYKTISRTIKPGMEAIGREPGER